MLKLDHLEITVDDYRSSRDFYVQHLGFKVEFELPERRLAAVQDEYEFTLFLAEHVTAAKPRSCVLTLQVDDVGATYRELSARGLSFDQPPNQQFWGYGAELRDPNGYLLRLWDAESMRTKAARQTPQPAAAQPSAASTRGSADPADPLEKRRV